MRISILGASAKMDEDQFKCILHLPYLHYTANIGPWEQTANRGVKLTALISGAAACMLDKI